MSSKTKKYKIVKPLKKKQGESGSIVTMSYWNNMNPCRITTPSFKATQIRKKMWMIMKEWP